MASWRAVEEEAPELAALARRYLDAFTHKTLATLRRDGSPRISGTEIEFSRGDLWLGSMWRSVKALDLLRDPRVYLHTPVTRKEGDEGEFKVVGRAVVCEDPRLRTALDDLFWQMIEWRPAPDSHYFDIDVERAAYVTYVEGEQVLERWRR